MLPSIFGESLFDDWFDFPFRGFESDVDHKLYGKHAARVMKTDLKEHDEGYELKVDLPGFKKDQIDLQLQNGYLTITASKGLEEEGKDKKGKIVHQERYSGSMTRSFYIGENVNEEDVKAKFEDESQIRGRRPDAGLPEGRAEEAAGAQVDPNPGIMLPQQRPADSGALSVIGKERDCTGMRITAFWKQWDERYQNNSLWQFVKFNLVSTSVSLLQLLLANILPLFFNSVSVPLPGFLRGIFDPAALFDGPSPYVVNGVVTWGYVLPFFLSNFIANVYGYFINMKATFEGEGTRAGLSAYLVTLILLILFSTWLQGWITAKLALTAIAPFARTLAAMAAGLIQFAVLFPLEKYVLFKKKDQP